MNWLNPDNEYEAWILVFIIGSLLGWVADFIYPGGRLFVAGLFFGYVIGVLSKKEGDDMEE